MGIFDEPTYLKKYGLKEPPYSTKPNERYLYLTPTHHEALAMVGKIVRDREGAGLIFGEFGTGKTTLMRRVFSELRDHPQEFQVGVIENGGHCPTDFQLAGEIIESFGHKSKANDRKGRSDQIKEILLENYQRNIVSVLLIDEAQELPAKVLEGLRGYLNFETGNEKILQIVLFALPNIQKRLSYAKTLANRLWKTELVRMSRAEIDEMLRWRFTQAGGVGFPFNAEAVDHLYEKTKGHPRTACGVAQLAIEVASMSDGHVTLEIIDRAASKRFTENL